jgi:hypothetical protein
MFSSGCSEVRSVTEAAWPKYQRRNEGPVLPVSSYSSASGANVSRGILEVDRAKAKRSHTESLSA